MNIIVRWILYILSFIRWVFMQNMVNMETLSIYVKMNKAYIKPLNDINIVIISRMSRMAITIDKLIILRRFVCKVNYVMRDY
jgi:hypothetical protein